MISALSLAENFSLVALNSLIADHSSNAKTAVSRGILAAKMLEGLLEKGLSEGDFDAQLQTLARAINHCSKKTLKASEKEIASSLAQKGKLYQIPALIGCDLNYYSAGVRILEYKADETSYRSVVEFLKAELLEPDVTPCMEALILTWLFRETGCLYDFLSASELQALQSRLPDILQKDPFANRLYGHHFRKVYELFARDFLRAKKELFRQPAMQGLNVTFPFLHRENAIFVDTQEAFPSAADRYRDLLQRLEETGHHVEFYQSADPVLLKIDNRLYETFPLVRTCSRAPVFGVYLLPYHL